MWFGRSGVSALCPWPLARMTASSRGLSVKALLADWSATWTDIQFAAELSRDPLRRLIGSGVILVASAGTSCVFLTYDRFGYAELINLLKERDVPVAQGVREFWRATHAHHDH